MYRDKEKQREARRKYNQSAKGRAAKRRYNQSDKGQTVSARQDEKLKAERAARGGTHGGARPHPKRPASSPPHRVSRPKATPGRNPVQPNTPAANRARIAEMRAREAARKRGRRNER